MHGFQDGAGHDANPAAGSHTGHYGMVGRQFKDPMRGHTQDREPLFDDAPVRTADRECDHRALAEMLLVQHVGGRARCDDHEFFVKCRLRQEIGGVKHPFDDTAVARQALEDRR